MNRLVNIPELPNVQTEYIQCALQNRVFSMNSVALERVWTGVLITAGTAAILDSDDTMNIAAPCLIWMPLSKNQQFRINAGGVGYHFTVGGSVIANAIGHNPESTELRLLADRRLVAQIENDLETVSELEHIFKVVLREVNQPRRGSSTMIEAQIRMALVLLLRLSVAPHGAAPKPVGPSRILQHFRQLLETHFRDRWQIAQYADMIGISTDRLHDICDRELQKSPQQLVQERVIYEARLILERSTQSVGQISSSLGFRDVGYFSRFFKAKVGVPPGAYRTSFQQQLADSREVPESDYSNWP